MWWVVQTTHSDGQSDEGYCHMWLEKSMWRSNNDAIVCETGFDVSYPIFFYRLEYIKNNYQKFNSFSKFHFSPKYFTNIHYHFFTKLFDSNFEQVFKINFPLLTE